jgi:cytochrome b pre-mRNA-processing protein 3
MSLIERLLGPRRPPLSALWEAITSTARAPGPYVAHGVPDTLDGRFDMVALVTALVMIRLEALGALRETALLTERFVDDMDGSLREIGVGDMVVGKHVGRMVGALGGRIGAYREALDSRDRPAALADALVRNLWRGEAPPGADPAGLATHVLHLSDRIGTRSLAELLEGRL